MLLLQHQKGTGQKPNQLLLIFWIWGRDCQLRVGGTETLTLLTKVLQGLGPVGLQGPSLQWRGESSLICPHSQGCPWTKSDGPRRREAGFSSQRPLTFYSLSAEVLGRWPTTQWVWMNKRSAGRQMKKGISSHWFIRRQICWNMMPFSFPASIIYCILLFVLLRVFLSEPL